MSYTPCKIGIISLLRLELNISEKRLELERISGLVELVPSSNLVLDKASIGYLFVKRTNLEVTILKITVLVLNKFVRPHLVL